jgi:hypothetical protein
VITLTVAPPRIDWFRVIVELNYAGLSNGRIAAEMLMSKGWVAGLKNDGIEPRYRDGQMLLGIWAAATGAAPEDAPLIDGDGEGCRARSRFLKVK